MEIQMMITREGDNFSDDIKITVDVEVDSYGVRPSAVGEDRQGKLYALSSAEMDHAAEQAWEEAHEE